MLRPRIDFLLSHTPTTKIYTLSLHDALPISDETHRPSIRRDCRTGVARESERVLRQAATVRAINTANERSEEHTSELQSHSDLVCRLLLEKKKGSTTSYTSNI